MVARTRRFLINQGRKPAFLIAVAALIASFAIWSMLMDNEASSIEDAFPYGEIRIGVDASFPPFAFDNGENMSGIDIELGRQLAEEIGLPYRFINIGFDGLYDSLISDRVDILISALQPDPARTRDFRYSMPYFDNGLRLISTNPDINAMESMQGNSLAYEFSSDADQQARTWQRRIRDIETKPYELPDYALDAVRLGLADAALVDDITFRLYRSRHIDWEPESHLITNVPYAIATRLDRTSTHYWVDAALEAILNANMLDTLISDGIASQN